MRIGIDARCLQGTVRSGVEEYARTLLEELFRQDTENSYRLFANAWDASELDFSWTEKYPHVSVRIFRWPNKLLNFCSGIWVGRKWTACSAEWIYFFCRI